MANRWEKMETVTDFIWWDSKITADGNCSHELKTLAPWKKSYEQTRQHIKIRDIQFSSVQSLSHVWLCATPWTAACQASLSITNFKSLLKLMAIESAMSSKISSSVVPLAAQHQSLPVSESFPMSQFFATGGQIIRVSASASVLPINV